MIHQSQQTPGAAPWRADLRDEQTALSRLGEGRGAWDGRGAFYDEPFMSEKIRLLSESFQRGGYIYIILFSCLFIYYIWNVLSCYQPVPGTYICIYVYGLCNLLPAFTRCIYG